MPIQAVSEVGPLFTVTAIVEDTTPVGTAHGVLLVSAHAVFAERYRRYDGTRDEVKAAMLADGFSLYADEVGAVYQLLSPAYAPDYVLLGRRDAADVSWAQAFTAIKAALDLAGEVVWDVLAVTRDESQQRQIAAAASAFDWLYGISTPSAAVRGNALGSLEKLIRDDGSQCWIISYDPATESNAAAPVATTTEQTWALSDGMALSARQDLNTPSEVTFNAAPAVLTANVGPYNLTSGWVLQASIDGLGPFLATVLGTPAVLTSTLAEPFALADGMTAALLINGVEVTWTVTAANYVNVLAATAAEIAAEALAVPAVAAVCTPSASVGFAVFTTLRRGTSASVAIGPSADAGWAAALAFPAIGALGGGNVSNIAATTGNELATLFNNVSGLQAGSAVAGAFRLTSGIVGTDGAIVIGAASTPAFLTALGFVVGTTNGTGAAANAAAVTAAEIFTVLSALVGPTVANNGDTVSLTGTTGIGRLHTLYIVGPLADALGIAGTWAGEGVAEDWAEAYWIGSRAGLDLAAAPPNAGHLTYNNVATLSVWGSRTLSNGVIRRLNREQGVNTVSVVSAARGAEYHDGRLLIAHAGGAPAYIDQWRATHWIAEYFAAVIVARFNAVSDANDQFSFFSEEAYSPFIIGALQDAMGTAVTSRALAFVDTDPPTPSKPTGVLVVPKAQLSPTQIANRQGRVIVRCRLADALHGLLVEIILQTGG